MRVSRISAALGASVSSQHMRPSSRGRIATGDGRGGLRTVPILTPSPRARRLPNRTIDTAMARDGRPILQMK